MTTYPNQIRHDVIPQPGATPRSTGTPAFVSPYNRADAASLPVDGLAEDAVLTPQQRRGIADRLVELYGEHGANKVTLLAKSDLYLVVRYNLAVQADKRQAETEGRDATRSRIEDKARAKTEAENQTPRFDAATNADAYSRGVADMNAWRNRADAADAQDPTAYGGLPQRAQAHHQPQPQPQGRFDAQSNEDAYAKGIDDMNAWRNQ